MANYSPNKLASGFKVDAYPKASRWDPHWKAPRMEKPRRHRGASTVIVELLESFIQGELDPGRYSIDGKYNLGGSGYVDIEEEEDPNLTCLHSVFLLYTEGSLTFELDVVRERHKEAHAEYMTLNIGSDYSSRGIHADSRHPIPVITERFNAILSTLQYHGLLQEEIRIRKYPVSGSLYGGEWTMAGYLMGGNGIRQIEFVFDEAGYAWIEQVHPWILTTLQAPARIGSSPI